MEPEKALRPCLRPKNVQDEEGRNASGVSVTLQSQSQYQLSLSGRNRHSLHRSCCVRVTFLEPGHLL